MARRIVFGMSVVVPTHQETVLPTLDRRRTLQLAGLAAAGVAAHSLVPQLTRPPTEQLVRATSFGDVRVLSAVRSAAVLPGALPLRAEAFGDAVTVTMRLRNVTDAAQWLPAGQFRARLLAGPAVTAFDATARSLALAPRSAAELSVSFLVPGDGTVAYLELTEPGALAPLVLGLPAVSGRRPDRVRVHAGSAHGGE